MAEATSIPVMVCYDGYLLSHTYMPFAVPEQEKVARFLPPFQPSYALDPELPANLNTVTLPEVRLDVHGELAHGYMEIRYLLQEDLRNAVQVVEETDAAYQEIFGRGGVPLVEPYRCDDAEYIVVGLGSLTYQLRDVVETLRAEGHRIGVLGVRLYRPFPDAAIAAALQGARGVFVMEKALSYGYEGALCSDLKSALYDHIPDKSTGAVRQGPRRRHRRPRDQDRRSRRRSALRHSPAASRNPTGSGSSSRSQHDHQDHDPLAPQGRVRPPRQPRLHRLRPGHRLPHRHSRPWGPTPSSSCRPAASPCCRASSPWPPPSCPAST